MRRKCAHQEEAAHETEEHTGAKLIWIGAVSTCVLKQSLNNRPRLEQPNSSEQSVHISPARNAIVRLFFFFPIARSGTHGSNEISFCHWLSYILSSINQLMGSVALAGWQTVNYFFLLAWLETFSLCEAISADSAYASLDGFLLFADYNRQWTSQ